MTVVRSREAERDVEEAAFWCEQQREGLGVEFVLELDAALERVETAPRQFPEIEHRVRRALLRRFPYAVYFVLDEQSVGVFAVLHQSRDPGTWKARL
jgi:plasmid stabilization system protein ParE